MKKFPTAYTILFFLIIFVAGLTWILPAGKYQSEYVEALDRNIPIAGTYHEVEANPQGITDVFKAPVAGFYDPITNKANAIDIAVFVLFIGGFLNVVARTDSINIAINNTTKKLKKNEILIIPILMTLFAIGGSTYGMAEETLAFYSILLPVVLAAGYDAVTAAAILIIGTGVGNIGSTINPFSTVLASNVVGVPFTSGIMLRAFILLVTLIISVVYVMRYAQRVKQNRKNSLVADLHAMHLEKFKPQNQKLKFNLTHKLVLTIFTLTFLFMIYGVAFYDASMADIAALFLFSSILVGITAKMSEQEFIEGFLEGAKDLLGVALVIGIARGIVVVMDNGNITDTILHSCEQLVLNVSNTTFISISFLIELVLSLFIPSSSGLAVITIPILSPLADIARVPTEMVITAYQTANGLVNLFNPTFAVVMGGLTMAKVPYSRWFRFIMPLFLLFTICIMLILIVGVNIQ